MYWETKKFTWLTLLWYLLYCGVLELNLQYLPGMPVFSPAFSFGSHLLLLAVPSLKMSVFLLWMHCTVSLKHSSSGAAPHDGLCCLGLVASVVGVRVWLGLREVRLFSMSPSSFPPHRPHKEESGKFLTLLCQLCYFSDLLQPVIPQTSRQKKQTCSYFCQNIKTSMHVILPKQIPASVSCKPVTEKQIWPWLETWLHSNALIDKSHPV